MSEQFIEHTTVCTFDILDHAMGLDAHCIELKALLANGGFQTVARVNTYEFPPALFQGVFKVCITGQLSHSKEDALS